MSEEDNGFGEQTPEGIERLRKTLAEYDYIEKIEKGLPE